MYILELIFWLSIFCVCVFDDYILFFSALFLRSIHVDTCSCSSLTSMVLAFHYVIRVVSPPIDGCWCFTIRDDSCVSMLVHGFMYMCKATLRFITRRKMGGLYDLCAS